MKLIYGPNKKIWTPQQYRFLLTLSVIPFFSVSLFQNPCVIFLLTQLSDLSETWPTCRTEGCLQTLRADFWYSIFHLSYSCRKCEKNALFHIKIWSQTLTMCEFFLNKFIKIPVWAFATEPVWNTTTKVWWWCTKNCGRKITHGKQCFCQL
jgi:hypothetical protein